MANENVTAKDRVVVRDQPVADFSHLTAPEQLSAISRIEDVALVVVPESLAPAYAAIPSSWAATVRLPDAEAAAIFQRIVGTPVAARPVTPRLDPSWWRHFTADFTARMISSTRPVRQAA